MDGVWPDSVRSRSDGGDDPEDAAAAAARERALLASHSLGEIERIASDDAGGDIGRGSASLGARVAGTGSLGVHSPSASRVI